MSSSELHEILRRRHAELQAEYAAAKQRPSQERGKQPTIIVRYLDLDWFIQDLAPFAVVGYQTLRYRLLHARQWWEVEDALFLPKGRRPTYHKKRDRGQKRKPVQD